MNKDRRKRIAKIAEEISAIMDQLREIADEEQDARDGLPENMQDGERAEKMDEAISILEEHIDALDSAGGALSEIAEGQS